MPEIHTCGFAENKNQPVLVKEALMLVPRSYYQSNCFHSRKPQVFSPIKYM